MAKQPKRSSDRGSRADMDAIAALHHPVRRRLLESLRLDGPATASQLAGHTGEMVGNVSHHLKVLGKAGLIQEAPELAKDRRERWWRWLPVRMEWSSADFAGEPAGEMIAGAAEEQNLSYHVDKVRAWWAARGSYDAQWERAAFATEWWVKATPEELGELWERINAILQEFAGRDIDDGVDREDIFLFAHGFPGRS